MDKVVKTAEFQLLQLIKSLEDNHKSLSNIEFISVLNAAKSICTHKELLETLIQLLSTLNCKDLNNKISFTQREKQILHLIGMGLKNTNIANELSLSKSTIETHRKNIRKKLKLEGNTNLFAFALIFSLQYSNRIRIGDEIFNRP